MSFDRKPREHKRGFTLVELVIVIAVIALLAAVLIPAFSGIIQRAKHSAALQEARGALTAFAVNTAAQTGADGSDVYVVSKFENGPFYFICANGELKDAPEGSLNRSLEDGEIIGAVVDDSYLIEGETGLEMSDALSSALAEIFGQEPRLNQHDDKAFVSLGGKTLEIASQPNLGDTMVFVVSRDIGAGTIITKYNIKAINSSYDVSDSTCDENGITTFYLYLLTDDSYFHIGDNTPNTDEGFFSEYNFKLYNENYEEISAHYTRTTTRDKDGHVLTVDFSVVNLNCNIIVCTDEDIANLESNDPLESSSEASAEESSAAPSQVSFHCDFGFDIYINGQPGSEDEIIQIGDSVLIFIYAPHPTDYVVIMDGETFTEGHCDANADISISCVTGDIIIQGVN